MINGGGTRWRYREGYDPYVEKGSGWQFYGNPDKRAIVVAAASRPAAEAPDQEFDLWLVDRALAGALALGLP